MTAAIYNSEEVSIEMATIPISDGRAEDDFISMEPMSPERNSMVVGASGDVTYSQTNDNRFLVKIKLLQKSAASDALTAVLNGDLAISGGAGIAPFSCIDKNGTSLLVEPEARIQGYPTKSYGKLADKVLEWVILCPNPTVHIGGL